MILLEHEETVCVYLSLLWGADIQRRFGAGLGVIRCIFLPSTAKKVLFFGRRAARTLVQRQIRGHSAVENHHESVRFGCFIVGLSGGFQGFSPGSQAEAEDPTRCDTAIPGHGDAA